MKYHIACFYLAWETGFATRYTQEFKFKKITIQLFI